MRNATIQRDLNIESLDDFITRIAERMFARVDMSGFSHLRELAPALERGHRGKAYPRELLQSESDATANIVAVGVATPLFPPPKIPAQLLLQAAHQAHLLRTSPRGRGRVKDSKDDAVA